MPETADRIVPTPAASDLPTFSVLLNGESVNARYEFMSITVQKAMNRISEAEIVLLDGNVSEETFPASDADDLVPGSELEIKAGYHQEEDTVFKGMVVKHAIKLAQNDASVLVLTLKHPSFKMALDRKQRVFSDQKDSEALDTILGEYSLTGDLDASNYKHENLTQFNATDWDFMVMRAEMNGMMVICTDDKIDIKKPDLGASEDLSLYYGSSLLEIEAEMDLRSSFASYAVSSWNPADQEMKQEDGEASAAEAGNISSDDLNSSSGLPELVIKPGGILHDTEKSELAKYHSLRKKLSKIRGRARCIGIASIIPGTRLMLHGVGDRFNGKVLVTGVSHNISSGKWETDIQFGLDPYSHAQNFQDISDPAAGGLLPSVSGLQVGVVTQLENDPLGENRIQVKIPRISDSDAAAWARISALDAGNERGSFFLPEIGDEVLLGFIDDDPRNAVVLGMMHSSALPAPLEASDDNPQKGFVSREKMKLIFDDEVKSILIETPGGNSILISDEDSGIAIKDQNDNKIVMDADGITIESAKDIKLKATGDIKVEGMNVEIKASAQLKAEGSAGAGLKSSGVTEIKGSLVNIN